MNIATAQIETYRLTLEQFLCSCLFDAGLPEAKLSMQYRIEQMAHQFTALMRVPADVLRSDDVIAEWPDGLWQTIRQSLRLPYRKRQVTMTEMLLFPKVRVLPGMKDFRVHVATMPRLIDYKAANEDTYE